MGMRPLWLLLSLLLAGSANAQDVVANDELLAPDRTEAWAMDYMGATTLMTPFGGTPGLAPGEWSAAVDLGEIPRLSQDEQRVGLHAVKQEDLNKSPVFGRLRISVGLPAGFVGELGWTPPVEINGLKTRDLFAAALGRRIVATDRFELSARVFGEHGAAEGDITCPARLAGVDDPQLNPYGCSAPSHDRIALRHYGVDMTTAWANAPWHWHATLGVARMEPEVQVDAVTGSVRDRSRLVTRDFLPYLAVGTGRDLATHWRASVELLYVPLAVRRDANGPSENDPLASIRLQLRRSIH
jgi:hypothetical protein